MTIEKLFAEYCVDCSGASGKLQEALPTVKQLLQDCGIWLSDTAALAGKEKKIRSLLRTPLKEHFDDREYIIKHLNNFLGGYVFGVDQFFSPEKVYTNDQMNVKLLKYLQSGEDTSRKLHRDDIAEHFSMSANSMEEHLKELTRGCQIMGTRVNIRLRRAKNTYDSTIHPVFLAMNLSEAYYYTVVVPASAKGTEYEDMAFELAGDIYSQLSDYARNALDRHIDPQLRYSRRKKRSYRRESHDVVFFEKSGRPFSVLLAGEEDYISGRYITPCKFITDGGIEMRIDPDIVLDIRPLDS